MQVNSQNQVLRTQLKESKNYEKVLQEQVTKVEEKYDKLKMFSNGEEIEAELTSTQRKIVDVKSAFECIDAIKNQWIKVIMHN